ncbi:MAG: hypothetical protein AAFZ65_02485 [Planctomycetota bacterium]
MKLVAVTLLAVGLAAAPVRALWPSQDEDWSAVSTALEQGQLAQAYELGLELLESAAGDLPGPAQQGAFLLGQALIDADDLARAADIQVATAAAVPADWASINASLTLARLGRTEEADGVLARRLADVPTAGELWNQRGVLWLGAGDLRRGRRHLARAVRYGSQNATLSLARLALFRGDLEDARAAFRPGVDAAEPHAWGLRGWAATLLPGEATRSADGAGPEEPRIPR